MPAPIWLSCARIAVLFAATVWPFSQASAIRLEAPEISINPTTGTLSNLRVRYVASAIALGDAEGTFDTVDKIPEDWTVTLSRAGQLVGDSTRPPHHSEGEYRALAQVGTLKGFTRARVENGAPRASADVYMQFMDLIQITREGKLAVVLDIGGGGIKNQVHPGNSLLSAGSTARADFYVWPHGVPMPEQGKPFDFVTYRGATWTEAGAVLSDVVGGAPPLVPGARYWVLGQLWLNSIARGGSLMQVLAPKELETSADLYHTAQFFLQPDPSTPDVSFTSASGFNYLAPVPEPSTWITLLIGIGLISAQVMRGRWRQSARVAAPRLDAARTLASGR
jgi:hypothetical protein